MNPLEVISIQCSLSILVFSLISKWYVIPKLSPKNKYDILALLLLINAFRYLPLSLFMPGQVSADFPSYLKEIIAYGDFLSGILALIALILLQYKKKSALGFTWLFSVLSVADILLVLTLAMNEKVYLLSLGTNYFTVSIYVPMLIVSQIVILKILTIKNYK